MLADSHIHLFANGFNDSGDDEVSQYENLIGKYSIDCALVVGYENQSWASGNNAYIASLAKSRPWLHPLAFVRIEVLAVGQLNSLVDSEFEGISLYILTEADAIALLAINENVWEWLIDHNWIVSVNSSGELWNSWQEILKRFPTLVLLISHLGLPSIDRDQLTNEDIRDTMSDIQFLCKYDNVYLKLSGFYALEPASPNYPYSTIDHYLRYIFENFSIERLLWGSDFTPALTSVTFDQTFHHLLEWPFKSPLYLSQILRDNLLNLLANRGQPGLRSIG
jgi:L-fuconolactonase